MFRVNFGFSLRPLEHVWLLEIVFAGDAIVFDAGIRTDAIRVDIRPDVILFEVVADVAVELAVIVISRISLRSAPDLAGTFRVTAEGGDTGRTIHRSIDAIARPFSSACDAVRFQDGEPYSCLVEKIVHPGEISALREPETSRPPPENLAVVFRTHFYLCANRRLVHRKDRQVGMCGGAGHDLDIAQHLKSTECIEQILPITMDKRVVKSCN